jgi:alpha-tubulin suppressor-like RCC1 family protein/tRNA A-37 threonylcarbamoyl transferase component Bud32
VSEHREDLPRFAELEAEYEVLRELGRGGTAVVYLAREREVGREVAIKVVRATYVEDDEAAARLVREARTVAGLRHPNIVMLHGTRRLADGSLALIMQYIHGRTLKQEIRERGALPFTEVERILADLGSALVHAQRHRILHRDIKPENIYLEEESGRACLSDFGIARAWDDCALTLPGTAIGTPAYMSPEQVDGAELDARSDIYSLGLVAYEMITGQAPWAGESLFRMIYKQKHEDLPAIADVRPDAPAGLRAVIERALRKDPDQRWADAEAFMAALGAVPEPGSASPPSSQVSSATRAPTSARSAPATPHPEENLTVRFRRGEARAGSAPAQSAAGAVAAARATAAGVAAPATAARVAAPATAARVAAPVAGRLERTDRRRNLIVAAALVAAMVSTPVVITIVRSADPGTASAQAAGGGPSGGAGMPPAGAVPWAEPGPAAAGGSMPSLAYAIFGDMQDGVAGDSLATPLVLRVEDAAGQPVAGATVTFAVRSGRGAVHPETVATDEHGLASARWLPDDAGDHVVEATVAGVDREPVTFRARVAARPAVRLVSVPAPQRDAAGPGRTVVVVRAEDDRGEPVAGAEIRFTVRSGGGRIEPGRARTGRLGTAQVEWTLGEESSQEALAALADEEGEGLVLRTARAATRIAVRAGLRPGGMHTCSLDAEGTVWCWGGNDSGQLGDGSSGRRTSPARIPLPEPAARLSAGVSHTCVVTVSGNAWCWGANDDGQLGDGTRVGRAAPVAVTGGQSFSDIFAGASHSCALDSAGRLFCWGQNGHGQLGDGTRTSRTSPVRAGGGRTFTRVGLGWAHTCGVAGDGTAYCWGRNGSGELGDGRTADRAAAAAVAGGHRFTAVAAGNTHSCGLTGDGAVLCWGQNTNGQLGSGGGDSLVPVPVAASEAFVQLTAGGVHTCALTQAGGAFCWGRNNYGQLGDGTNQDRPRPVAVAAASRFASLQASGAHTCGTAAGASGSGSCWGFNLAGQLGDGSRSNQARPVPAGRQR